MLDVVKKVMKWNAKILNQECPAPWNSLYGPENTAGIRIKPLIRTSFHIQRQIQVATWLQDTYAFFKGSPCVTCMVNDSIANDQVSKLVRERKIQVVTLQQANFTFRHAMGGNLYRCSAVVDANR